MKSLVWVLGIGILIAFLQTTILSRINPPSIRPDLFIFLVVYLSMTQNTSRGGSLAWLLGLLKDCFAGVTFGLHGFAFVATFLLARLVVRQLNPESSLLLVLLVSCATAVENGLIALSLLMLADAGDGWRIVLQQIPAQVVVGALLSFLFLPFIRWGGRRARAASGPHLS
ncbi:MAG: rod shape-determining protein MreD [Geoalkalibacter sp.]|uniref:rod shape-determining protein MreD n=1 Tax=Geoalkalibacter sp. TaxID=3041440 RepID=UPI003D11A6F4